MPSMTMGAQTLFYTHNGTTAVRPALILVHGAGATSANWPQAWQTAVSTLADFPVYTLDLPGHGRSPLPGCQTVADYAAAVAHFVQALDLPQVVVVGHSMGAAIALTLGGQQPDWLAGLLLIGGGAHMPVNPAMLDGLQNNREATIDLITKFSWYKTADEADKRRNKDAMLATDPIVLYEDFAACNQFDVRGKVAQITIPTLLVCGSDDKMMPPENSQYLAVHLPQAELAIIENAGHYVMVEKEGEVTAVITDFLQANG